MENGPGGTPGRSPPAEVQSAFLSQPNASPVAAADGIAEEELLAISAALAAFFGVQPHIRQIRLIRTGASGTNRAASPSNASHSLNY